MMKTDQTRSARRKQNGRRAIADPDQAEVLMRDVFGCAWYRDHQQEVVEALLAGRDAAAVMPTGSGKSLCYQIPSLCREGVGIVVSPLISLMKDQVDKLCALGVHAGYLNSSLSTRQQGLVFDRLKSRDLDLLYVAPERFQNDRFCRALKRAPVALFAIDEAHCISEWGHDFRPDYLKLSELRTQFPKIPIAAFTATATHRTRLQIASRLGLEAPHLVLASFDRPNLYYEVRQKYNAQTQVLEFIRERPASESGIVYCFTRRGVEEMAEHLRSHGIDALPYHAGLDQDIRRQNQETFLQGRCRVVVATIAFGMGIDKADVRFVVHADLPKNVEGYYQETGRAGRDGRPAHCLLFHEASDARRLRYFIDKMKDPCEQQRASMQLRAMGDYAHGTGCHRRALLNYFGEAYRAGSCSGCEHCASAARAA